MKKLLGLEPNLIKLLSARIVTDEDHRYFISFAKHHPQLQLPEFVRLILHYYAKILFNFDPSDPEISQSAWILKNMMQSVLDEGIRKNSDILQDADIDDVAMMVASPPRNKPREILATLFFVDTMQRHITTEIPRNAYAQHMVFSVMALIQATLSELDQECIDVLNRSLAGMNDAYDAGQSYSDPENLAAVPTKAYLSTIMDESVGPNREPDVSNQSAGDPRREHWGMISLNISKGLEDVRLKWFDLCVKILRQSSSVKGELVNTHLGGEAELAIKGYQLWLVSGFLAQHAYISPEEGQDFAEILYAYVGGTKLDECMAFFRRYHEVQPGNGTQLFLFASDVAKYITGKEAPLAENMLISSAFPTFVALTHMVVAECFGDKETVNELMSKLNKD